MLRKLHAYIGKESRTCVSNAGFSLETGVTRRVADSAPHLKSEAQHDYLRFIFALVMCITVMVLAYYFRDRIAGQTYL